MKVETMSQYNPEVYPLTDLRAYDFELPEELIAQHPVTPRDASRLLVVDRKTGKLHARTFRDLPEYFDNQDLFVANNSKVMPARLRGQRIDSNRPGWVGGKVEVLLLEPTGTGAHRWEALFQASAKGKVGVEFQFADRNPSATPLRACIIRSSTDSPEGTIELEFDRDPLTHAQGELPLPPYIVRPKDGGGTGNTQEDLHRYQTVYAKAMGSAAAPTAGLHFTPDVLSALQSRGSKWEEVTLHVGIGTFRPVKSENILDHKMHEERFEISEEVAQRLSNAKKSGNRITAVGTTSVRTLESAYSSVDQRFESGLNRTGIFIHPGEGGHQIAAVDRLITNFHLPKSSLMMLVSAFATPELIREAYAFAIREKFRFFSYGDAMLIL